MTKYEHGQYTYSYDGEKLFNHLRESDYEAWPDDVVLSTMRIWDLITSENLYIVHLENKPDEFWEQMILDEDNWEESERKDNEETNPRSNSP